jgi:hypothetical protein
MVVVLGGTFLVVGCVTRRIMVVMGFISPGAVHDRSHLAWIFANNPGVESGDDSNQQDPWQEISHDVV